VIGGSAMLLGRADAVFAPLSHDLRWYGNAMLLIPTPLEELLCIYFRLSL
jgi:hypothetical protein